VRVRAKEPSGGGDTFQDPIAEKQHWRQRSSDGVRLSGEAG